MVGTVGKRATQKLCDRSAAGRNAKGSFPTFAVFKKRLCRRDGNCELMQIGSLPTVLPDVGSFPVLKLCYAVVLVGRRWAWGSSRNERCTALDLAMVPAKTSDRRYGTHPDLKTRKALFSSQSHHRSIPLPWLMLGNCGQAASFPWSPYRRRASVGSVKKACF